MKYDIILTEMKKLLENTIDGKFLGKVKKTDPNNFNYIVEFKNDVFSIMEQNIKISIYTTENEVEADELCDEFNHDKDQGKDALIHAIQEYLK